MCEIAEVDNKGKFSAYTSSGLFDEYKTKENKITFKEACRDCRVNFKVKIKLCWDYLISVWILFCFSYYSYFNKICFTSTLVSWSVPCKVQRGTILWVGFGQWWGRTEAKEEQGGELVHLFRVAGCHSRIHCHKQVPSRDLDLWVNLLLRVRLL